MGKVNNGIAYYCDTLFINRTDSYSLKTSCLVREREYVTNLFQKPTIYLWEVSNTKICLSYHACNDQCLYCTIST